MRLRALALARGDGRGVETDARPRRCPPDGREDRRPGARLAQLGQRLAPWSNDATRPERAERGIRRMQPSRQEADDRELMARLAAGERDALAPLMARHYRRLYRIALAYLRQPDDALDVVQEAFVKAYQNAERWDGAAEAGPWLARIAVNLSIDRWRRNKRRLQTFTPLPEGDHETALADAARRRPQRSLDGREARERRARRPRHPARAPARGGDAAPLPGAEPGGDRDDARHEPRHREEHAAPRAAPDARRARSRRHGHDPRPPAPAPERSACSRPASSRAASASGRGRTSRPARAAAREYEELRRVVRALEDGPAARGRAGAARSRVLVDRVERELERDAADAARPTARLAGGAAGGGRHDRRGADRAAAGRARAAGRRAGERGDPGGGAGRRC